MTAARKDKSCDPDRNYKGKFQLNGEGKKPMDQKSKRKGFLLVHVESTVLTMLTLEYLESCSKMHGKRSAPTNRIAVFWVLEDDIDFKPYVFSAKIQDCLLNRKSGHSFIKKNPKTTFKKRR